MQISTRSEDFIIDALHARRHMHILRHVFLDPAIVKVFHGANEDMKWLQRDFGIYVVNLFDTGVALQALHHPHSLSHLLQHFCSITPDKRYQLADWRVRPLSEAMMVYARGDTHYLLYCYDRLRNVLLDPVNSVSAVGNLLRHVWEESRRVCLTLYEKGVVTPAVCDADIGRHLTDMTYQQVAVARAVYMWRDALARSEDESVPVVMSNASVVRLGHALPLDAESVTHNCVPMSRVVHSHLDSLVAVIKRTLETCRPEDGVVTTAGRNQRQLEASEVGRESRLQVPARHIPGSGTLPSIESDGQGIPLTCSISVTLRPGPQSAMYHAAVTAATLHNAARRQVQSQSVRLVRADMTRPAPQKREQSQEKTLGAVVPEPVLQAEIKLAPTEDLPGAESNEITSLRDRHDIRAGPGATKDSHAKASRRDVKK